MKSAVDALMLPSAQLNDEEKAAVALLEIEIGTYIDGHMERRGCYGFKTEETRSNVIADMNQRLRVQGWGTEWKPVYKVDPSDSRKRLMSGWTLDLFPTDESYNEAMKRKAN